MFNVKSCGIWTYKFAVSIGSWRQDILVNER